ncbi:hypothetical protein TWF506_004001 [Arthrobotrys conoides]|uniref:Uncharacterized protein n=1 Tax=Arthrobotrys conoides TaxID=74498 RepID=A0AAN8RIJ8_9PEZI
MNPEPTLTSLSRPSAGLWNNTHEPEIPIIIIIAPPLKQPIISHLPSYWDLKEEFSRTGKLEIYQQAVDDLSAAQSLLQLAQDSKRFL